MTSIAPTDPLPPGLARFCRLTLPELLSAVDPTRTLQTVRDIVETDRWNSFDRFHQTNRMLASAYEACGATADLYTIPTGESRGTGKWIIPEAEDIRGVTLEIVEPIVRRIADYRECPWHFVQWSAATPPQGVTGELIAIDSDEELTRIAAGALDGKLVLTRLNPAKNRSRFAMAGAAGLICDSIVANRPDAVAWTKFGWGGLGFGDEARPVFGIAISSAAGDELRGLIGKQSRVVVRARVDVRQYSGSHEVVSGIIPGRDDPDSEIWAVAHAAEPGALDNASGVAACVAIARTINKLVLRGQIPPPRRTIRFLHGYECYGFFHYLEHAKRFQSPLAGVCIDTVGALPAICGGELRWHATAPASASFVDEVGAAILQAALAGRPVYRFKTMPFLSTEDTLLGDPKYGFPCPWITNHPATGYHSSADTIEMVDEQGLAICAGAMAGYLYYLANIGSDDALELARWQTDLAIDRLGHCRDSAKATARAIRQQLAGTVGRLQRFLSVGDHAQLTQEFDRLMNRAGPDLLPEGSALRTDSLADGTNAPQCGPCRTPADGEDLNRVAPHSAVAVSQPVDPRATLIPIRRLPLAPTPENVSPDLRPKLGHEFPKWAIYWADGDRSLAEIAALAALDAGAELKLPQVIDHFEALALLGYVDLIAPSDVITEAQLVADLSALGVKAGVDLIVHSSMRSIGPVRGGAASVVRALISVLSPSGTLLAPTFNHHHARVFNPLTTPTNDGAIPEAIWRRADAKRSLHPSHSIAAIGPRADDYLRDHLKNGVWSADSPIGRLIQAGGHILSIGVGHDRSTAYHVGEIALKVPCLDSFGSIDCIMGKDGQVQEVCGLAWRAEECPVDPAGLDALLDPVQSKGRVGHARATLALAEEVFRGRIAQLGGRCGRCPIRPNRREGPSSRRRGS